MTHSKSVRVDTNARKEAITSNRVIYKYMVYIIIRIYYSGDEVKYNDNYKWACSVVKFPFVNKDTEIETNLSETGQTTWH